MPGIRSHGSSNSHEMVRSGLINLSQQLVNVIVHNSEDPSEIKRHVSCHVRVALCKDCPPSEKIQLSIAQIHSWKYNRYGFNIHSRNNEWPTNKSLFPCEIPFYSMRPKIRWLSCVRGCTSLRNATPTSTPEARLTKAYDVTIERYRYSHAKIDDSKTHILRCMGSKFCVKFQSCLWYFTQNFEPTQCKIFILRGVENDDLWYLRVMTS